MTCVCILVRVVFGCRSVVRLYWLGAALVLVRSLGVVRGLAARGDDRGGIEDKPTRTAAVADRGLRMVHLGRQSGPDDDQRVARLQERHARRRRHEPAEVRRQGPGRQVPGRADLGRPVLRRASPRRRRRPPGEEGHFSLPLAAEQGAHRPAPMVRLGSQREPSGQHPSELSARRRTGSRSCARTSRPSSSSTSRTSSGSSPTTPSSRSRSRCDPGRPR